MNNIISSEYRNFQNISNFKKIDYFENTETEEIQEDGEISSGSEEDDTRINI